MTSKRCDQLYGLLQRQEHAGELSDSMALHLDGCPDCRRELDVGRVELDPAVFERLTEERRQALVGALAGARAGK